MRIELIISIVSGITAILSIIISCIGLIHNRYQAVDDFFTKMEDEEFIAARNHVYNSEDEELNVDDKQASIVVNFFHHWEILAKKKYLPMWVFDGASGAGTCRLYCKTKKYIEKRREKHKDPYYAEGFEWLYKKIEYRNIKRKMN